jgi:hypothetical protein
MSLERPITGSSSGISLPADLTSLLVAAAGNGKRELVGSDQPLIPAMVNPAGKLIVVASHDANGKLSHFSNFGAPVTLAAPGCGIMSWLDGEGPARPVSGTSMAAAVVSFAAALLRSRWNNISAVGLRNRLLASARYEYQLAHCEGRSRETDTDCVQWGSMLDIEAALLLNRDYVEYEECPPGAAEPGASRKECVMKTAVGRVDDLSRVFGRCTKSSVTEPMQYGGLSLNAAVKRTKDGPYLLFFEPAGEVGLSEIKVNDKCTPPSDAPDEIVFTPRGEQLDGTMADPNKQLPIKTRDLVRIVLRALRN